MRVELVLPAAVQDGGSSSTVIAVVVDAGARVRDVLDALDAADPLLGRRIRDEAGQVRRHVNVYVGGDDTRGLLGQDTPVTDGATVLVLPSVAGG